MVELSFGITVDPAVRFGRPVIRGRACLRILLSRVSHLE